MGRTENRYQVLDYKHSVFFNESYDLKAQVMDVAGKKVTVLGARRSGMAVAELLSLKGASVFVSELGTIGAHESARLQALRIPFEEGGHSDNVLCTDFCVISPGIPGRAPVVRAMLEKGIPLFSEIEVAYWFCKARIIGITGTDGKTTTATLVHRIFETDGMTHRYRAFSVGNIGQPFSSRVLDMRPEDVAVIELSSYQLEGCCTFRPDVSVITNITPDHLDRYEGELHNYAQTKYRIYAHQGKEDTLVYNDDDPLLHDHFASNRETLPCRIVPFGIGCKPEHAVFATAVRFCDHRIIIDAGEKRESIIDAEDFLKRSFRGRHNIANALAAVAAARALGIGNEAIRSALQGFSGVEHRQEFVRTLDGSDWINDSKATNINALSQALETVPGRMVLIAGGRDKGSDYREIAGIVRKKVTALVAIGEAREKLCAAYGGMVDVRPANSLEEAVSLARALVEPGQTVLFSPGCSSFDMFEDFEDRGRQFKKLTMDLRS
jgi:UDP-N-acetylmuramoylalanine--D-glutamate ligase